MTELPPEWPIFRNTDPPTSRLAAEQFVGVGKKAKHEQTILWYLRGRKSSKTCQEIADGTGMEYHAIARRMKELESRGFVRRVGTSINSGRPMTEWEMR